MEYKEQFTAFLDLLGFSEASRELDEPARRAVHALLLSLANMRSNFAASAEPAEEGGTRYFVTPAISTFSDNIVISYDLEALRTAAGNDSNALPFLIFPQFENLITVIAARAPRLGYLLRGAATVGKIHHTSNVIFGNALVEAVQLEPSAIYPRIVLSAATLSMLGPNRTHAKRDSDVAVGRWQAFTDKSACLLADGRSFDHVSADRLGSQIVDSNSTPATENKSDE
jgi:hypothetical protein